MNTTIARPLRRVLACAAALGLVLSLCAPGLTLAVRQGATRMTHEDTDGDGQTDRWTVDWDGDGEIDEVWSDTDGDGTVDMVTYTADSDTRSPRMDPFKGPWAGTEPIEGGGSATGIDWDGDGDVDEVWWDYDGDGVIDDTTITHTESCIVDNTKSRTFRGVFVGVNQDLKYAEKDAKEVKEKLEGYSDSWDSDNMDLLTGDAATPDAVQNAVNQAKSESKPGDEFVFYFSGHGGGYDKDDGYAGGIVDHVDTDETPDDDDDGDERAIPVPESRMRMDASDVETASPGSLRGYFFDMDGDGDEDTAVVRDDAGNVTVRRYDPGPPANWGTVIGTDTDGDGDVDQDDGGIDYNNDGDTNDTVYFDDTIELSDGSGGGRPVTDDQLVSWLSGFPESVTINVILDSCYSGSFIPDLSHNLKDADGKDLRPGHLEVITAAPADDEAWEKPISHGVLTMALLNALNKLPASVTGDHATTVADYIGGGGGGGASDDITTTRELFHFAGPQASAYFAGDEDGDGFQDEDGTDHSFEPQVRLVSGDTTLGVPSAASHAPHDDDGDLDSDEDEPIPPESFFDVYWDPDFGGQATPTFIQCFGGDRELSATGLAPGFALMSDIPPMPGTPGPILEAQLREAPRAWVESNTPGPPGLGHASDVYDAELYSVDVTPALDASGWAEYSTASLKLSEVASGWAPGSLYAVLGVGDWVPPGLGAVAVPYWWDEGLSEWSPFDGSDYAYEPETDTFSVQLEHLSLLALFYPGPSWEDTTGPLGIGNLFALADGMDVRLSWSNPTAWDWSQTRILHSATGFADTPSSSGQQLVYSGRRSSTTHHDAGLGTHYYTMFSYDFRGNWTKRATAQVTITRDFCSVSGTDRYSTAVKASKEAFPNGLMDDKEGYKSVVVATGENWPDALGGSALAGAVGGPMLLVRTDSLPSSVASEIERLGAERVFVVGGPKAVSAGVFQALGAVSGVTEVERVSGTDRYATANAVARRTVELLYSYDGDALLATGLNFPDSLAAAPLAACLHIPLFLTPPTSLDTRTRAAMQDVGVSRNVYLLGGEKALTSAVQSQVGAALPGATVSRLHGSDRYRTAVEVAKKGAALGMRWNGVGVATGEKFPDGLSGGVMLGRRRAVMLLTPTSTLSSAAQATLSGHKDDIADVNYIGGTGAVSQTVRNQVSAALQ
ncbi:MAG: hypothetical protein Kow0056_09080 [Coriobacteriia bacterium]